MLGRGETDGGGRRGWHALLHDTELPVGGCPLAPPLAACVHALGMPGMTEAPLSAPRLPVPPLPFNHLGVGSPEGAGGAWQCLSCF